MKKILLLGLVYFCSLQISQAKKVKFGVDMSGQVLSPNGIHVTGDFQTLAGFAGGDWNSSSTLLSNETGTDIYSIVVDIPAFQKYEYKFVNGDQFYEVEFIPVESRVGYNFNDNRWIYVDSLADDTTYVGALLFGGNAPAGLSLLRFKVDMENIFTVNPVGVHLAGNFQGFDPSKIILYSFVPDTFEVIQYLSTGYYEYKYFNGNTPAHEENVPGPCSNNSNRYITLNIDTVLPTVCFSDCGLCVPNSIQNPEKKRNQLCVFPNPANDNFNIDLNGINEVKQVALYNFAGQQVQLFQTGAKGIFSMERNNLPSGNYFIVVSLQDGRVLKEKLQLN